MSQQWLATILLALNIALADGQTLKDASREIRKLLGVGGIRWLTAASQGTYYFNHDHKDGFGAELWRSDMSLDGTYMVKDIHPGPGDGYPSSICSYDGHVFLAADDGEHGVELWSSDGTKSGTRLFLDINPGVAGSSVQSLTACGDRLYFGAMDAQHGFELWTSDGTVTGTAMLLDITPGSSGSQIGSLECKQSTAGESRLFFVVGTQDEHAQWITDGTTKGTQPLDRASEQERPGSLKGEL